MAPVERFLAGLSTLLLWTALAAAQSTPESTPPVQAAPEQSAPTQPAEDKRIFGVLPNNRIADASVPFQPITAKRKFTIAYKDSTDLPVYPTAALFALIYQLEDQNPSFGQGMKGYAKRFATAYGDQVVGNMMTEGIVPSLTHEDPRYFRLGSSGGSTKGRLWYALTRTFVTRTDSGGSTFNIAEWGGNAATVAISQAYYPDTRTAGDAFQKLMVQCATDTFSNVLKEFWPDVKKKLQRKK